MTDLEDSTADALSPSAAEEFSVRPRPTSARVATVVFLTAVAPLATDM